MQFHQILVSANPGDAITNAAFELRTLLRQAGPSEIYSLYIHPDLDDDVKLLREFATRRSAHLGEDILIFHASIGEPEVTSFVASRPERLIVMYHNISPSERFLPFDPRKAGLLAAGRIELELLADKAQMAITVSEYNAGELRDAGFRNVRVTPLVVDVRRLLEVEPYQPTVNHLETIEGPIVLYVGQMLPHKRPELLIEAYHALTTNIHPEASLVMVGNHLLPKFSRYLEYQINELNLNKAWLAGAVSLGELVAFYRHATMFVTMSEHEGFCVPLLESMGFGVPTMARDISAIPETMGDAGLLLPPEDDPFLAAEGMAEIIENHEYRELLIKKGHDRVARYDPDIARAELLSCVLELAAS
jgi:glycosyltransferase involved in cell wall biosynthesis